MAYKITRNQMRPLINMNGTSREQLVEQRSVAAQAIWDAMVLLRNSAPHGRDYQGYPDNIQFERDRALYAERYCTLDRIRMQIEEEALAIQEGKECE